MIPVASEDIECSTKLFPHFIHVCSLTTDFLDRAAKVIKIPHHRFSSERMKVHFKVHQLDTLTTRPKLHGLGLCPFFLSLRKWIKNIKFFFWFLFHVFEILLDPAGITSTPTIYVCKTEEINKRNGVSIIANWFKW